MVMTLRSTAAKREAILFSNRLSRMSIRACCDANKGAPLFLIIRLSNVAIPDVAVGVGMSNLTQDEIPSTLREEKWA